MYAADYGQFGIIARFTSMADHCLFNDAFVTDLEDLRDIKEGYCLGEVVRHSFTSNFQLSRSSQPTPDFKRKSIP